MSRSPGRSFIRMGSSRMRTLRCGRRRKLLRWLRVSWSSYELASQRRQDCNEQGATADVNRPDQEDTVRLRGAVLLPVDGGTGVAAGVAAGCASRRLRGARSKAAAADI